MNPPLKFAILRERDAGVYILLLTRARQKQFQMSPDKFIVKAIREYIKKSPDNRFDFSQDDPIWDEPVIAFADGNDPLFQEYKTVIGEYHATPREVLEMYLKTGGLGKKDLSRISVISWVLPSTAKTRLSMRPETTVCSLRWNHTRLKGQEINYRLERYVVSLLESQGYLAVAPDLAKWWSMIEEPGGLSCRWSQRHVGYAAGLGTFSLNDGFITTKGIAIRLGSVVTNLALPVTSRPYANHLVNCLFFRQGNCGKCIPRCPARAISEKGHDKKKCEQYLKDLKINLEKSGQLATNGFLYTDIVGCGFCQTGVPCENCIPQP